MKMLFSLAGWLVEASTVLKNYWGDPLPQIISQLQWIVSVPETSAPPLDAGISYKEWLCCATPAVDWGCTVTSVCDPYARSRRWSPRRNHAAVTVYPGGTPYIIVLGGRAQSMVANPPADYIIGGVIGEVPAGFHREPTILMNDVWASQDGSIWTVQNVGCFVPTAPFNSGQGSAYQQCSNKADCVQTLRLGSTSTVNCVQGRCLCTTWQPRERHAATVVGNDIYVSGGITTVTKQDCAALACGGGYTVFLNDVWRSTDSGVTWVELQPSAPWTARADHAFVYGSGQFWLMAGRGGVANDYALNPMFNDVWVSPDAVTWTLQTAAAPWGPRAGCQAVYGQDVQVTQQEVAYTINQILLVGGEQVVPPTPTPSPLAIADAPGVAALYTQGFTAVRSPLCAALRLLNMFTHRGAARAPEFQSWRRHPS